MTALCEEKPAEKEVFLPIIVFFDELDWTPIVDNHEYTKVVREYVHQLSALEDLRNPDMAEVSLRDKMRDPENLKKILSLAKARFEMYKEQAESNKDTRRQDFTSLTNSIDQLETRIGKNLPKKDTVINQASKNRQPTAKEKEEISQFLKKFGDLLRAEKYSDLAMNNLSYQEELRPSDIEKVLPQIVERLQGHVKDGCVNMIGDLLKVGEWWMTSPDDAILVLNGQKSGVVCLHRVKGEWKCCHITMGNLSELDALGIPRK